MDKLNAALEALAPGWVGSLIGILGILIGGVFFLKSRERSRLGYETRGDNLLGHDRARLPGDVTVEFGGRPIPRLTRSLVALWNCGEKTIQSSDTVTTDPLRVDPPEASEILAAKVVKVSRGVNNIQCAVHHNLATMTFDFLDPRDGAVIEILHTGEQRHLQLRGTFKGMPKGIKKYGISSRQRKRVVGKPALRAFPWILVLAGMFIFVAGLLGPQKVLEPSRTMTTVIGFLYGLLGAIVLWRMRRKAPRALSLDDLPEQEEAEESKALMRR